MQGPQGEQGEQGPEGPQGPQGVDASLDITIVTVAGTTHTADAANKAKVVEFTSAAAVAVTLPASMPVGHSVTWVQAGAGQVTFAAGAGATVRAPNGWLKTRAQWAVVTAYVRANNGGLTAAEWVLAGDLVP